MLYLVKTLMTHARNQKWYYAEDPTVLVFNASRTFSYNVLPTILTAADSQTIPTSTGVTFDPLQTDATSRLAATTRDWKLGMGCSISLLPESDGDEVVAAFLLGGR